MIHNRRYEDETPLSRNLALVLHSNLEDVCDAVRQLPATQRSELAVYCHTRAHLREKGLAIASLCDPSDLVTASSAQIAESLLAQAASFARANSNTRVRSNSRVTLYRGQHV